MFQRRRMEEPATDPGDRAMNGQSNGQSAPDFLASIVQSSEDAIISKDLNGTILTWNAGASLLYGYSAEEMIGASIGILAGPERLEEEEQILARIRAGERVHHFQ